MKGALLEVYRWLVLGRDESAGRLGHLSTWQTNPPPQTELAWLSSLPYW